MQSKSKIRYFNIVIVHCKIENVVLLSDPLVFISILLVNKFLNMMNVPKHKLDLYFLCTSMKQ